MLLRSLTLGMVDDHVLFRKTLKGYLTGQINLDVVAQASDMAGLLDQLKVYPVDVLLMDLFMPGLHGGEAVKTIRNEYPETRILVLSMSRDLDLISDLLELGIHGYISKSEEPEELLRAIRTVSENRIFRNGLFTEALYWSKQNKIGTCDPEPSFVLSDREKRILLLLWEEKSSKEIADELFLGVRSVEKIRQELKEKLGVKSTVGLLKYALANKIIDTDPDPATSLVKFRKNRIENWHNY